VKGAGVVLASPREFPRKDCIMNRKWLLTALLALPLVAAGLVYGKTLLIGQSQERTGYVCPLTGEELPCPNCCPLNEKR
jgi:hypothetical protein